MCACVWWAWSLRAGKLKHKYACMHVCRTFIRILITFVGACSHRHEICIMRRSKVRDCCLCTYIHPDPLHSIPCIHLYDIDLSG